MEAEQEKISPETVAGPELEGEIRINHSVIASIIRISTLEVAGVAQVGGGFFDGVAEMFSKKDSDRGVAVKEDGEGRYAIDVRVVLFFGYPLAEVATQIQRTVAQQVAFMTQKSVARVNVTIDGVKVREPEKAGTEEK
jgi:uncharacterized alkaline shock family protein YloU